MSIIGTTSQWSRFGPQDIPGLQLWLDAADSNTITMSGSNVAAWADKSINGYTMNAAPSGCALPILGATLNGLSTVGIDTTSTGIKQATVIDGFTNAFWVRKERNGNQGYQFYFGADGTFDFHTGDSGEFAHGAFSPQGVRDASLSMFTSNGVTRGTMVRTVMPAGGLVNLVSISNVTGSTKLQGLSYDRGNTTRSATCDWGEVLLYSNALTTAQIQSVEGYLARKWGITTYLPATQPFRLAPAVRPFSPLDIDTMALWLDAADSTTLTFSGSAITTWRDKSGFGNNATATGSPTLSTASFGGRPTILLDGGSMDLRGSISITGPTFTAFAVYQPNVLLGGTRDQRVVSFASAGNQDWNSLLRTTGINIQAGAPNSNQITTYRNGTVLAKSDTLHVAGVPAIGCSQYTGSTARVFMNAAQGTTLADTSGNFGISTYGIGNQASGGTERLNGNVAEVLVYIASLSTVQRQQIEGYLSDKWGLRATIGRGHPFRYLPPPTFTPTEITGCSLWLDGADATTLFQDTAGTSLVTSTGQTVRRWNDKSGRGCNATQAGNAPTWNSAGFTTFTRTNSQTLLLSNGTLPYSAVNTAYSMFAVVRPTVPSAFLTILCSGSAATNQFNGLQISNAGQLMNIWFANDVGGGSVPQNVFSIASAIYTGSSRGVFLTGSNLVTVASSGWAGTISNNIIGRESATNSHPFGGDMGEIIVYPTAVSTSQRQVIEGYLAWKWGRSTALPSSSNTWASLKTGVSPLFAPNQIAGCALWLDGGDSNTVTLSGSAVTAWADKSGNGVAITVRGTGGLTYSSNSVRTVSGQTSYFSVPVDLRKTVTPNISLFLVYTWLGRASSQVNSTLWGNDAPNSANRVQFLDFSAFSPNAYGYFLNGTYLTNPVLNTSSQLIYAVVDQVGVTNGSAVWINGGLGAAGTGTSVVNTPAAGNEILYFGAGETNVQYPSFVAFNEILVYSNALTTGQRQQVEGYLAWKWGRTADLSAAHPYKTFKP